MKRVDQLRFLEGQGCRFVREGGSHTVYLNPVPRRVSVIPRHREINEFLVLEICKHLEIPPPSA